MKKKLAKLSFISLMGISTSVLHAQAIPNAGSSSSNAIPGTGIPSSSTTAVPGQSTSTTPTTKPAANQPFKYPALSPAEAQQFNQQMLSALQQAEDFVNNKLNAIQDQTIMPSDVQRVELQGAVLDLDVKKTVYAKFQNSPSLKSPKVRAALLQFMNKRYIQESDIAILQAITDSERPYTYP